jgi:gamma-glutamylaminecyclotransferase
MNIGVYGTLREGCGNHVLLNSVELVAEGRLDGWAMLTNGSFPTIVKAEGKSVLVEVYDCDDQRVGRLNLLEGYPTFYRREKVELRDGTQCEVYVCNNPDNFRGVIESGDWRDGV